MKKECVAKLLPAAGSRLKALTAHVQSLPSPERQVPHH